jgi:uncharacterized membrane protein YphA (DoxX/SURF4 family)
MNAVTSILSRILFGLPFIGFGAYHFIHTEILAGLVPVPGGTFWVYLTGVALIAAGLSILTGFQAKLASLLLALLLVVFALGVHLVSVIGGDMASMSQMMKDLALAGGALAVSNIFAKREKKES